MKINHRLQVTTSYTLPETNQQCFLAYIETAHTVQTIYSLFFLLEIFYHKKYIYIYINHEKHIIRNGIYKVDTDIDLFPKSINILQQFSHVTYSDPGGKEWQHTTRDGDQTAIIDIFDIHKEIIYWQISNISHTWVENKLYLEHRLWTLLQLHFHSQLNIWFQWIGKRQVQDETKII